MVAVYMLILGGSRASSRNQAPRTCCASSPQTRCAPSPRKRGEVELAARSVHHSLPHTHVRRDDRAANSVCSLPPCGGGLGRGVMRGCTHVASHNDPPP